MESWAVQLIISLGGVIVTLGGVIGIIYRKSNNLNGIKNLDKEFTAQVLKCNDKFLKIAEDRGMVKTSLKSIDSRLEGIEKKLSRRK